MENLDYMPPVEFIKVAENAVLPQKAHPEASGENAGYDLTCTEETVVPARATAVVPTGIEVGHIPDGYWFRVEARSGLSFKHKILPHPGIIDTGYRGPLSVMMYNHSDTPYTFKAGDRIAQIVFYYNLDLEMKWGAQKSETKRGEGRLGSTGR